jgi:hypothetical protein
MNGNGLRHSSKVRYLDLVSTLSRPKITRRTIGILLDGMGIIPMWPQLKDVFCKSPDMLCFLPYVIGPNTSSIQLWFGSLSDEEDIWGMDAPEMATILSTIEDRSGPLDTLGLCEVRFVNDSFYEPLCRLVSKNGESLTKITLYPLPTPLVHFPGFPPPSRTLRSSSTVRGPLPKFFRLWGFTGYAVGYRLHRAIFPWKLEGSGEHLCLRATDPNSYRFLLGRYPPT